MWPIFRSVQKPCVQHCMQLHICYIAVDNSFAMQFHNSAELFVAPGLRAYFVSILAFHVKGFEVNMLFATSSIRMLCPCTASCSGRLGNACLPCRPLIRTATHTESFFCKAAKPCSILTVKLGAVTMPRRHQPCKLGSISVCSTRGKHISSNVVWIHLHSRQTSFCYAS